MTVVNVVILLCLFEILFVKCELMWNFPPNSNEVFHAYVNEKAHTIQVFPSIQVNLTHYSKLCSISLLPSEQNNVPYFISGSVLDQEKGYGYLTFNESLYHEAEASGNLEARIGFYHLKILGEDCSHPPKYTISWPITFEHIRSDLPIWSRRRYEFNIDSLHPPGYEIGKVTAYSSTINVTDGNPPIGDDTGMCVYTIQDASHSFAINGHGVIRSLVRFNNRTDSVYEFNVTGFDCHLPVPYSSSVSVTVYVKSLCTSQWNGIPKEIAYPALSNPYLIAVNAKFSICPQRNTYDIDNIHEYNDEDNDSITITEYDYCPIEQVTIRMKILWSKEDIIVGDENTPTSSPSSSLSLSSQCDLDYYSMLANRKTCISSSQHVSIDLLPDIEQQLQHHLKEIDIMNMPTIEKINGLDQIPKINHKDYPSGIYYFNGSTQLDLNKLSIFNKMKRFDNNSFTINFWMKHTPTFNRRYEENLSNGRENILCSADEYEKNRHHFAIFLHNCKLVVLIRREPTNASMSDSTQLLPSQWRFDVDEVCDSSWHHYSITYHPPEHKPTLSEWDKDIELQLYVDGQLVPNNPELVQVAENMPMIHLSSRNHEFVRTSVGACWHGRSLQFTQHFVGYLAGLTFSNGYIQNDEELRCLTNCEPRLFINDPTFGSKTDRFDTTSVRNSHLNSIIIQAKSLNELSNILRQVTFYNPRLQYKPRYRPEPVAIQLNTMFVYSTDCEMPSTFNQVILISPLPPTRQTLAALDAFSLVSQKDWHHNYRVNHHHHQQKKPYDSEETLQRSPEILPSSNQSTSFHPHHQPHQPLPLHNDETLSSVTTLVLSNVGKHEGSNQTFTTKHITSATLSSGISIFPYLTLMWKVSPEMMKMNNLSSIFEQTVSLCTINLCDSDQLNSNENLLSTSEFLHLEPEYKINDLKIYQHPNGITLYGSSGTLSYMNALKHVQWFYKDESTPPPSKRCFNASCKAVVQTSKTDQSPMKINSNSIQSEFVVHREETGIHDSSYSSTFIQPSAQQHSARLSLPSEPRLLAKRHTTSGLKSDMQVNENSSVWSKSSLLLISSSVLAVLLLFFVAVKRIQRIHSKSRQFESQTQNLHMIPYDNDALKETFKRQQLNDIEEAIKSETTEELRNPCVCNKTSSFAVQNKQQQHDGPQPLRIIPNPIVNRSEMREFTEKTILLDEKRYNTTLNIATSIYNCKNERNNSPIICNPTLELYENPIRSDQEDEGDFECSCCENDDITK